MLDPVLGCKDEIRSTFGRLSDDLRAPFRRPSSAFRTTFERPWNEPSSALGTNLRAPLERTFERPWDDLQASFHRPSIPPSTVERAGSHGGNIMIRAASMARCAGGLNGVQASQRRGEPQWPSELYRQTISKLTFSPTAGRRRGAHHSVRRRHGQKVKTDRKTATSSSDGLIVACRLRERDDATKFLSFM